MNEPTPPRPPSPPFGDDTDEAISAWLDGELAGFAADHECSRDEALARLEAWPPAVERRDRLDAARRAVGAEVAVDDLRRRRLVHTALADVAGSPARRRRTRWWATAAAAAALVLGIGVIGWAWVTAIDDDGARSADSTTTKLTTAHGDLGDLGEVSDPARLRALLGATDESAGDGAAEYRRSAGSTGAPDGAPGAAPSSPDDGETDRGTSSAGAGVPEGAAQRCADQLTGGGTEVFRATGTYEGAPAVVLGLEQGARTIVLVVAADDCLAVLTSVSR